MSSTSALMTYSRMIKVSHTIFSLPFALAAAILASQQAPVATWQIVLIIGCILTARSTAMGFNRIADRDIDGDNPRTANREIPSGAISLTAAWGFTAASAILFVAFSALLGNATLMLSPIALLVVCGYSLTKRFTWLCHVFLGAALALAPTGVWIALTGSYSLLPFVLSLAVGTWVAGFDVIYACQDAEYDRSKSLRSMPASLGVPTALNLSIALHVVTGICLALVYWLAPVGPVYWLGWAVICGVLAYEHSIVSPDDLSRVDKAFFDLNGYISLAYFAIIAWAVLAPTSVGGFGGSGL